MTTANRPVPCYTIEFGTRRIEFYPLLMRDIRKLGPVPAKEDRKDDEMYERQMQSFLMSAQRMDPTVTREMIEEVVATDNIAALTTAIYAVSGLKPVDAVAPTSPQTGG